MQPLQPDSALSVQRSRASETDAAALVLAAIVALAIIAFVPVAYAPRWTPRAVVYLVALPWGLIGLARLCRVRDRAAFFAVGFLTVATVSALLSPAPFRAVLPVFYRHESVVAWAAGLGVWALVRTRDPAVRRTVELALVGAVLLSCSVGIVQLASDVRDGPLAMIGVRASGLSLNPVYFGALAAAVASWCLAEHIRGCQRLGVVRATLLLATIGVWISGSRIALLAFAAMVGIAAVRSWRILVLRLLPWIGGGLVAGEAVRWLNRSVSGGRAPATTERLGSDAVASGFSVRFEVWGFDLSAIGRRPLFGHGPGSHSSAIQPHLTADFVERTNPDSLLNNWTDAHNIVIELLTTVGVAGLIAAVGFAVTAARSASGSAAWAALPLAATWLVQPVSHVTLIPFLALLALAGPTVETSGWATGRGWRVGVAVASLLMGGWLIVADTIARRAADDPTLVSGQQLAAWWWHDPMSAWDGAVHGLRDAVVDGSDEQVQAVLGLANEMTDRDPELAFWWVQRGDIEQVLGRDVEARASYRAALERQPWSRAAIVSLIRLEDDPERLATLRDRLRVLDELADGSG